MIAPPGRPSQSWSMILVASRVSCRRTQQRAKLSPSGWVQTLKSTSAWARPRQVAVAAQVPVDARGPQVGAAQAVAERHLGGDDADAAGAGLEDLVAEEQRLDLVAEAADAAHDGLGVGDPALGQVVLEAADAVEVGVEAPAGDGLDLVEHVLAVAEGVERRRHGPELDAQVAEEQHDVGQAGHLEEDRADVLGPGRGLDLHQLLGGEDEGHLVGEAAQPVDAVDQGRDLRVGADLGELLVAPVHVARAPRRPTRPARRRAWR